MRISNQRAAGSAALVTVLVLVVGACGGAAAAPSQAPTAAPTPTPTPNPHLAEPASVDVVFSWLNTHGLTVIGNNADSGASGEPLKRINATYGGWPLILSQYSSSAAARKAVGLDPKDPKPTADEAPFTFLGLNIVVEFGPHLRRDDDPAPDARFVTAATALATALDPILGPLGARTIVHVALPVAPTASPSPAAGSPSASPRPNASPSPTTKPKSSRKPKATPKPTG